jgi:hypothetical protein
VKLSAFRDNVEFTVVSSQKTCTLMRLTKIRALGDEINENKKISPVLTKNIMKKTKQRILYVQYTLMGLHMETKVQGPYIYLCFDARPW